MSTKDRVCIYGASKEDLVVYHQNFSHKNRTTSARGGCFIYHSKYESEDTVKTVEGAIY